MGIIDKDMQQNDYFEYRCVDSSMYKNTKLPRWIEKELPKKDLRILDYGCGFGQNLLALRGNKYSNIYGVDIESNAIQFCLENNLDVRLLDLENLNNPFDFKFNVIILTHIIEHIPKNEIIETLLVIKNHFLIDGGFMLVAVPNAQANTGSYWMYEDWTHHTLFTSGSLYYVMKSAGFDDIKFLDIDATAGKPQMVKIMRKLFIPIYKLNKSFWNAITASSYHKPSCQIFSYEIKARIS